MTVRSFLVAGATALTATLLWSVPPATAMPAAHRSVPAAVSGAAPNKGPVGWDVYRSLDRMAEIPTGVEARSFSSFDRTGGNGDSLGAGASCLSTAPAGCLLASHDGPGEIDSIWFTNIGPGGFGDVTPDGNLRVEVDGHMVVDRPLESLVEGAYGAPFVYPLVANRVQSSGGVYLKVPMAFRQSMRLYTSNAAVYYHVDYRVFADDVGVSTFDPTDPAADVVAKLRASGTADPKPPSSGAVTTSSPFNLGPGQSATLATETGPGSLSALHLSLPALAQSGAGLQSGAGPQVAAPSAAQAASGSAQVTLDGANQNVRLVYRGPPGTPPQRAPLFVDGQRAGPFTGPAGAGAFTQTLDLPGALTAGRSRAVLTNLLIVPGSTLTAVSLRDGQPVHSDVIQPAQQSSPLPTTTTATPPVTDLLAGLRIRLTFDGQQTVDLPVGKFFASPLDGSPVSSLLLAVRSSSLTSWQLMPYATKAVAELYNGSSATVTGSSDVTAAPSPAWTTALGPGGSSGYFRAVSHEADTGTADFPLLDQSGPGKLLGVSLTMDALSPGAGFLEGDERFTLDGSRTPQKQGTGTEDVFEGGWYFSGGTFSAPFTGLVTRHSTTTGCAYECFSAYRFFVADSVPFHAGAHLSIEHGNRNDTAAHYAATAYLYTRANPSVRVTGAVDLGQAGSESAAHLTVQGSAPAVGLTSSFEGPYDRVPVSATERTGSGVTTFTLPADAASSSVTLRRTSDQAAAGQAARVAVNGQDAGLWTQPLGNTTSRWLEDDYRLPPALTSGASALKVSITPLAGSPPWSSARYAILCEGTDAADTTAPSFSGGIAGANTPAGGVSLSWLPAADNSPSVHYRVYRSATAAPTPATATLLGETAMTGFVDSGAELNSTEHYIVQPVDESGNVGQPSPDAAVNTSSRIFQEGENIPRTANATAQVQSMTAFGPGWSGGAQEWLQATAPGQSVTFTINVPTTATYGLTLGMTRAPDYGTAAVSVDGTRVGPVFDGYSPTVSPTGPLAFGFVPLGAGSHQVSLTVVGRNPSAVGYFVGEDYLQFDDVGPGDPILRKDGDLAATGLNLGSPVGAERQEGRGIARNYQAGEILWTPGTGAHEVHGAIRAHYDALGGSSSFLGFPATDETGSADGRGRFNHFSSSADGGNVDGSVYWTPSTGALSIRGAIRAKWASLGWERSFLGYPVTDETATPDGFGRFNHFSSSAAGNIDGSVYWTPSTGAWSIRGAIRDKWASLGWERSFLGYPVTDETATPDGFGRFNHFSSSASAGNIDGSVYWTPSTGAWSIHGLIRALWSSLGWERSCLGYPISDEFTIPGGRQSNFPTGVITFFFSTGRAAASC